MLCFHALRKSSNNNVNRNDKNLSYKYSVL